MEDIQCGPLERSLLTLQDDHISTHIWRLGERDKLDVRQLTAKMGEWVFDDPQRHLLDYWGFRAFSNPRSVPQKDIALITALVERWRPETNTFHFPFGEMTITLEDVYMILGLPVSGRAVTHAELDAPKAYWVNHWEDSRLEKEERAKMYDSGVKLCKLRDRYARRPSDEERPEFIEQDCRVYTRAYLLYIIGGILFPASSRDTVHPRYLQLIQDTDGIVGYAWGAAVLSYLFRGLSRAANKEAVALNGCTLLLQLWAWERLLPGRPQIAPHQELRWPRSLAWAEPVACGRRINPHHHTRLYRADFDIFHLVWVTWQPYARFYDLVDEENEVDFCTDLMDAFHMALGRIPLISFDVIEYVMPDRVLRQFGMLQHIPEPPIDMSPMRMEGRPSNFERVAHIILYQKYREEWDSFVATGMPIVEENSVSDSSMTETNYKFWFQRVGKTTIAPFVAADRIRTQPRDLYPQQDMADAVCF
jgi:hypothetical protein